VQALRERVKLLEEELRGAQHSAQCCDSVIKQTQRDLNERDATIHTLQNDLAETRAQLELLRCGSSTLELLRCGSSTLDAGLMIETMLELFASVNQMEQELRDERARMFASVNQMEQELRDERARIDRLEQEKKLRDGDVPQWTSEDAKDAARLEIRRVGKLVRPGVTDMSVLTKMMRDAFTITARFT
jgi:peptidoglycan hydrolase CwlO-like protein